MAPMICLNIESPTRTTWENRFRISHTSCVLYHRMSQSRGTYGASLPTLPPFDIALSTESLSAQTGPNGLCRSRDETSQPAPRFRKLENVSSNSPLRSPLFVPRGKLHSQDAHGPAESCRTFHQKVITIKSAHRTRKLLPRLRRILRRNPPERTLRCLLGSNKDVASLSEVEGLEDELCLSL